MALLMALTALDIDVMLPALHQIASRLGLDNPNDAQLLLQHLESLFYDFQIGMEFSLLLFVSLLYHLAGLF